jgi:hypothetical protein
VACLDDGRAVIQTREGIVAKIQAQYAAARKKRKASAVKELSAERRDELTATNPKS